MNVPEGASRVSKPPADVQDVIPPVEVHESVEAPPSFIVLGSAVSVAVGDDPSVQLWLV